MKSLMPPPPPPPPPPGKSLAVLPKPAGPIADEEDVEAELELDDEDDEATLPRRLLSPSRPVAALKAEEALGAELDDADDGVELVVELVAAVEELAVEPDVELDESRPWSERLPLKRGVTREA